MTAPAGILLPIASIAATGLGLNLYLLLRGGGRRALPGCGPSSDCDAVLSSRWSRWLGRSVALPGAAVYLALLTGVLLTAFAPAGSARAVGERLTITAALLAGAAAVWFLTLQALVLRRLCLYCAAQHALGLVTCLLILGNRQVWATDDVTIVTAVIGSAALVGGQVLLRSPQYVLSPTSPPSTPAGQFAPQGDGRTPEPETGRARDDREVSFLSGRLSLTVGDWPVLGDPGAALVVAYLFDYTCPTCRKGHRNLLEALALCGDGVAILLVPAPVDPSCNPHVRRHKVTHAHACRYARLGLDVWRHAPSAFAEYDGWVFESGDPPPIGLARGHAERLTGAADLDPATPDGELDDLIARGVETYRKSGAEAMPTLLFPHAALRGELPPGRRLAEMMRDQRALLENAGSSTARSW